MSTALHDQATVASPPADRVLVIPEAGPLALLATGLAALARLRRPTRRR